MLLPPLAITIFPNLLFLPSALIIFLFAVWVETRIFSRFFEQKHSFAWVFLSNLFSFLIAFPSAWFVLSILSSHFSFIHLWIAQSSPPFWETLVWTPALLYFLAFLFSLVLEYFFFSLLLKKRADHSRLIRFVWWANLARFSLFVFGFSIHIFFAYVFAF